MTSLVPPRPPLTSRQRAAYEFIRSRARAGASPTIREIAAQLGIRSTNGVCVHLRALQRKGYIERVPNRSRGIRVLDDSGLPFLGEIA